MQNQSTIYSSHSSQQLYRTYKKSLGSQIITFWEISQLPERFGRLCICSVIPKIQVMASLSMHIYGNNLNCNLWCSGGLFEHTAQSSRLISWLTRKTAFHYSKLQPLYCFMYIYFFSMEICVPCCASGCWKGCRCVFEEGAK